MAAKLSIVVRKMFTLTTLSMLLPAASRTAERLARHCLCVQTIIRWPDETRGVMPSANGQTYSPVTNTAFYDCLRLGIRANAAGAVYHSLALDGLREEGQWRGRLVGNDSFLLTHDEILNVVNVFEYWTVKLILFLIQM